MNEAAGTCWLLPGLNSGGVIAVTNGKHDVQPALYKLAMVNQIICEGCCNTASPIPHPALSAATAGACSRALAQLLSQCLVPT